MALILHKHWAKFGEKNIPNVANTHIHDYIKERKNNSMFIGGVTEYDVTNVVKNLKKKVSQGL